jgi:hypothetical protein
VPFCVSSSTPKIAASSHTLLWEIVSTIDAHLKHATFKWLCKWRDDRERYLRIGALTIADASGSQHTWR